MQTSLRHGSVAIRPFRTEDSPLLFSAARESIVQLCAWMTWCTPTYSLQDSEAFISNAQTDWHSGKQYLFAILDAEDETFLGSVGLSHLNRTHNFANIGIWVRNTCTGKGVASGATRLIAEFAFRELNLSRLEILVANDNQPSIRVATKVGAVREGLLRKRLTLSGATHDAVLFSLLAEDLLRTSI